MNAELTDKLFKKYPAIYKNHDTGLMQYGVSVGDGWYPLIDVLSGLLTEQPIDITAVQVKEKFGALRFYIDTIHSEENSDFIGGLCYMAEFLSMVICDECGKRGRLCKAAYLCTRCDEHSPDNVKIKDDDTDGLPFYLDVIGRMWRDRDANPQNYPTVKITEAHKENGNLVVSILGAEDDKFIDGMMRMLDAYASIVNEETGEVLREFTDIR